MDYEDRISELARSEYRFAGRDLRLPLVRLTREYGKLSESLFEPSSVAFYVPFDDGVVVQCGIGGFIRYGNSIGRFRNDSLLREATSWERIYYQKLDTGLISDDPDFVLRLVRPVSYTFEWHRFSPRMWVDIYGPASVEREYVHHVTSTNCSASDSSSSVSSMGPSYRLGRWTPKTAHRRRRLQWRRWCRYHHRD